MRIFFIILLSVICFCRSYSQTDDSLSVKDSLSIKNSLKDSIEVITPEIKVEAEENFMRIEDDKTIYDISKIKMDPGPNALELMRKIPMVTVENENILLRGSSPKILINGRESQLYGDLKTLPTDLIESIEVMTIAPSKYEAEGINGVINIVLKKFEESKYRISLTTSASTNNSYNTYLDANYKKDKFSFFLNSGGNFSTFRSTGESYTKNLLTNELSYLSNDSSKNNFKYLRINPGIIYDANKNLYFGVEGVFGINNSVYDANSDREYSFSSQTLLSNSNTDSKNYSLLAYINQKEIFEKDELNFEFNLNNNENNSNSEQEQLVNNSFTPLLNNISNIENNNYTLRLDYSKKAGENFNFETGLRENYKKELNDYINTDTAATTRDSYGFTQRIYSYYGTLSYILNSFRIKPGIRMEYADLKGVVNSSFEFTNYMFDIFPSLTITKFFSDNTQLQFAYGKKIERPRFGSLNPYPLNRDIYNTVSGNPNLQPSYTHSFELRTSKPFGKQNVNLNVSYRHITDLIQSIRNIDSIYTHTTFINEGYLNEYGLDGGVSLSFEDFFYFSTYGGINKKIFSNDSINALSDRLYYYASVSAGYSNPDLFNINANLYYSGKRYSAYSISNPFTSFSISMGKQFFDNKLSVNINISDPFKKNSFETRYIKDNYEQYSNFVGSYSQTISIYATYSFGNYDEKRTKGKNIKEDSYD